MKSCSTILLVHSVIQLAESYYIGPLLKTPSISRETGSAESKGYGFIYYDNFEASDSAVEAMNGQYLMNRFFSLLMSQMHQCYIRSEKRWKRRTARNCSR